MTNNPRGKASSARQPSPGALSEEVLAALGTFTETITASVTQSLQATVQAEIRVIAGRMDNQDKLLEEKFRHLEARQSQETGNIGARLSEDRKAIEKLSDEMGGFKRHMDTELQSLRRDLADTREQFKANNSGLRLADQEKEIAALKTDVTMLKEAHLKGQGRNATLSAIWGAVGAFVVAGLIYLFIYLARNGE